MLQQNNLCDHNHNHVDQALSQFLAILVTLGFAVVGGVVTGLIMHQVQCNDDDDNDVDADDASLMLLLQCG